MRANFICDRCHISASIPSNYIEEARRLHQHNFHPQGEELVLATWDDLLSGLMLTLLGCVMLLIAYLL